MKIVRGFVYATVISLAIFIVFVLAGIPVGRVAYFVALAAAADFFLVRNLLKNREIAFAAKGKRYYLYALLVAAAAGGLSFWGATRVVPVLQDHDSVMECPAYGLATTLKPYCIETRVPFYFAKGPTSHFIYAFPLVLTDRLERVKHYYDTSQAALRARDFKKQIVAMWHAEFGRWFPKHGDRVIVETRTTSIYISVMLALLLFAILAEIAPAYWLAALLNIVFLTLPEIFVRNSYAGYQNISNFFLLLALYHFIQDREDWLTPLLLATTNQKCVLVLGLAVGAWLLLNKPNWRLFVNKTLLALLIGMVLLYAYGLAIHPPSLLVDQFQRHGIDRLLHQNPNKGMNYPSVAGLWSMFAFDYGYPFLLLALASVALLFRNRKIFPRAMVLVLLIASTRPALFIGRLEDDQAPRLDGPGHHAGHGLRVPGPLMAGWQNIPRRRPGRDRHGPGQQRLDHRQAGPGFQLAESDPHLVGQGRMKLNHKLLVCMARALYPKEPLLTPEEKAQVEEEVVSYLAGQILAMPSYLKVPYAFALHGFNYLACLRYALPFTLIGAERQGRYVRFWSRSPIGLMRDFIKLIRSVVLLSYLDHPLVLQELESGIKKNDKRTGS